jgi:hypothetical protein
MLPSGSFTVHGDFAWATVAMRARVGRDWVRKAFGAYFTVLIEIGWGKQREDRIDLRRGHVRPAEAERRHALLHRPEHEERFLAHRLEADGSPRLTNSKPVLGPPLAMITLGPRVCGLAAGGRWIRTLSPSLREDYIARPFFERLANPDRSRVSQKTSPKSCENPDKRQNSATESQPNGSSGAA